MPSHWSRRALLASVGTAALAGCAGNGGDTSTDSVSPTRQPTAAPASFPEGEPDPPDTLDSAWPVPGAEPGRSNYLAGANGPTEPVAELWSRDLPRTVTDPVVAGERLYVGAADALHALDARTGDQRWQQSLSGKPGRPWVVDGSVYVPTDGGVVALGTDGDERWRVDLPSVVDGGLFAASHGVYVLSGRDEQTVVAFDRADGSERWRTAISRPWTGHLFASDASVFVSSGGSGTRPWRLAADTGDLLGDPPTPVTDSPNPRFYREGTVFSRDFLPAAVDARPAPGSDSGHEWRERISVGALGALSAGPDHLYCVAPAGSVRPKPDEPDDGPGLYALGLTDGSRAWSATDMAVSTDARPAVTDGTVLVPTADALHCFDPADGARRWAVPGDDIGGTPVVVDDLVYATDWGTVRAFRPP